jgi:hypothetical protein
MKARTATITEDVEDRWTCGRCGEHMVTVGRVRGVPDAALAHRWCRCGAGYIFGVPVAGARAEDFITFKAEVWAELKAGVLPTDFTEEDAAALDAHARRSGNLYCAGRWALREAQLRRAEPRTEARS